MKNHNKGFTLIELLVAVVLSSIVLMGTYSMFDSIIRTKETTGKSHDKTDLLMSARRIIKPDILQLYRNTLSVSKSNDNDELSFVTANSIKLEKALPVKVRYYVDGGYLIREESSSDIEYEWKLYLLKGVKNFKVKSHNGYEFSESIGETDRIIQIYFEIDNLPVKFIAGTGHTNLSSNYEGKKWN